jgi:glyoxylase-like metal-dependent hydrolase (beta-lactamase superfamily II)
MRSAVIIDPVDTHFDDYLDVIAREELTLAYVLETHAHADHVTSAGRLCQSTGAKAAAPVHCAILPADIQLEDGAEIRFGGELIGAIHTPGHTAGSMSYLWRDRVFTGDLDSMCSRHSARFDLLRCNCSASRRSLACPTIPKLKL